MPGSDFELRHRLLLLRDFAEATQADGVTAEYDGLILTYSVEDGFHAVPPEGDPVDLTEWVDDVALVPVVDAPARVDPHVLQLLVPDRFGGES